MTGMMNLNLNSTTGINPPHTPLIKPLMVLMGNAFQVYTTISELSFITRCWKYAKIKA